MNLLLHFLLIYKLLSNWYKEAVCLHTCNKQAKRKWIIFCDYTEGGFLTQLQNNEPLKKQSWKNSSSLFCNWVKNLLWLSFLLMLSPCKYAGCWGGDWEVVNLALGKRCPLNTLSQHPHIFLYPSLHKISISGWFFTSVPDQLYLVQNDLSSHYHFVMVIFSLKLNLSLIALFTASISCSNSPLGQFLG